MNKQRTSNFEIMRILSMFFIVFYHFIIATGGDLVEVTNGNMRLILYLLSMLMMVHVNSYILITGYFQYNKKFKLRKLIDLLIMAYTYKVIIGIIYLFIGIPPLEKIQIIRIFNPLEFDNYWFIRIYILLYILSPYINIIIEKLNKKEHLKLIIILFILFSCISTLTNQRTISDTGFSIVHFVYLYILGAYLNKYNVLDTIKEKIKNRNISIVLIRMYIVCGLINFLLYGLFSNALAFTHKGILFEISNTMVNNLFYYQTPILIIQSIAYFLFFNTFSFTNNLVNKVSSCILSVYLITENNLVRTNMYKLLDIYKYSNTNKLLLVVAIYSILIILVCIIIELIRKYIMKNIYKIIRV